MKWLRTAFYLSLCLCISVLFRGVESGVFSPRKEKDKNDKGKRRRHRARVVDLYEDDDYHHEDDDDDFFESLERQAASDDENMELPPFSEEEREEFEEMMQMIENVDWGEGSVEEISTLMHGLGLDFTEEEIESLASVVKDEELAHSSDMLGEFREVIAELQKDGQSLTEAEVMEVIEAMGGKYTMMKYNINFISSGCDYSCL